jgi:hypothetical protein
VNSVVVHANILFPEFYRFSAGNRTGYGPPLSEVPPSTKEKSALPDSAVVEYVRRIGLLAWMPLEEWRRLRTE